FSGSPVKLDIEAQAGWIVAGLAEPGWLNRLTVDQARTAVVALAGLYKLAGIDMVREQIQANLPPGAARYDLRPNPLVVWTDRRFGRAIYYDLGALNGQLKPRTLDGGIAADGPTLESDQMVFRRVMLPWDSWVETWQQDQAGKLPSDMFKTEIKLLPPAM